MNKRSDVVYLISANGTNLCKIGYSSNLEQRLKDLKYGRDLPVGFHRKYPSFKLPLALEVIKTFDSHNSKEDEKYLHRLMQSYRALPHRLSEWFVFPSPSLKDLSWFRSYQKSSNSQAIEQIDLNSALFWLDDLGIDTNNDDLLSVISQCKNNKLLQSALQAIADDMSEVSYAYPIDYAVHIIYSMAVSPG